MSSIFAPTPAETTLVHQIFLQADPQKLGVVTGDAAVKIFDRAKLPPTVLADIWTTADDENNGWLSRKGVAKAVRLIGWAQQGRKLTDDLLEKPGPLAKFEGINSVAQQNTGMSLAKSPLTPFPVLTPQDNEKYLNIFRRAGPVNGLLSGEKARDIFLKSKLPNDQLVQIWNLADSQDRGVLDSTDFAIGMFFINGLMSKTISFIPTSLPPGLYQQAGGRVTSHLSGNSGNSSSFSPVQNSFSVQPRLTGIQPNHTGMSASSTQSRPGPALPARPSAHSSPFHHQTRAAPAWDVTPADKINFDAWFDDLDKQKVGYIEGDVAVPFMLQSGLPGDILATVWDLADINSDGRLTRDGFAVAMHLIQKKLAGGEVPDKLPPSLIPPSMRHQAQPEPVRDLFSFDDSPPPSAVSPQQTGGFPTLQPQQTGTYSTLSAQPTGIRSAQHDPFLSSVSPTHTGSPRNFLDDDEPTAPHTSPPLQDKSAEIGNTKNQLTSTNRSLDTTRAERAALEQTLANQAAQLSSLQTQLSSAKAAYETEVKLLSTLKDRHSTQVADMQRTREELIRAESDLSALKVEKAEIEGSFMRDKEDARELHRRMVETGQHADAIKVEVEKIKKDAKQQKGLLAIAKKQLSSKEAEKLKAEKELEEATAELTLITTEQAQVDTALANLEAAPSPVAPTPTFFPTERAGSVDTLAFAAAHPLPTTPDLGSPSLSLKSNNPFDRLKTGASTPRSQSPFAAFASPVIAPSESQGVFDANLFISRAPEDKPQSIEGLPYDSEAKELNGSVLSRDEPASPVTANESDLFHTPPTSARNISGPSLEATQFPPIDDFTAHFTQPAPAADKLEKFANGDTEHAPASNLDAHVKELEIEESDSESEEEEEDEDEIPLSQIKQNVTAAQAPPKPERAASFDDVFGTSESEPTVEDKDKGKKKEELETSETFDDIFASPPKANGATAAAEPTVNGSSVVATPNPFPSLSPPSAAPVAGVDVFDETLGKLTPNSSAVPQLPQTFSFDTAFEDNFDFAAATDFTPAPEPIPQPQAPVPVPNTTFDDIFSAPAVNGHPPAAASTVTQTKAPEAKPAEAAPAPALSFDDIFAGAAATEGSVVPNAQGPFQPPPGSPFPQSVASPQKAPSPEPSSLRPSSPLPERLPPARSTSPKPRLSSSSKEERGKEPPPVRHSKLSLRLPFGRNKKKQQQQQLLEPMPSPPSFLSPHPEQAERAVTPAVDDDVEPVKQLTSMGFSRTQAVIALERYGYDVQLALNSLLQGS